jgi:transposase-like protein
MQKRKAPRRTAAQWAEIIGSWERGGADVKTFAARMGLRPGTLTWWRWRLRNSPEPAAQVRLVRVDVAQEPEPPSGSALEPSGWQLVTKAGALRVGGPLRAAELSMILAALTGAKAS